ncbi:MAG: M15 family metallopeptidase [Clostridia bacterium]|nr:M15 family metallopeptidase [Clostridia bacterium]
MSREEAENRNKTLAADVEAGNLFIINKKFPVGKTYKASDLAAIKYFAPDRAAETRFMRSEAAQAFNSMIEAAAADGYKIVMTTAYRSYDFQSILYTNYVKKYGQSEADTFSAKPGTSEHQGGLAADISASSVNYQLLQEFGETDEGRWIAENAHKFGFILRYPEGKTDVTGYIYEPWHVRYVGKTAASEIKRLGCTLEEYCNMNGIKNDAVSVKTKE